MDQGDDTEAQQSGSTPETGDVLIIGSLVVGGIALGIYNVSRYQYELSLTDGPPWPNPEGVLGTFAVLWLVVAIGSVIAYFRLTDKMRKSAAILVAASTIVGCAVNAWVCVLEAFKF